MSTINEESTLFLFIYTQCRLILYQHFFPVLNITLAFIKKHEEWKMPVKITLQECFDTLISLYSYKIYVNVIIHYKNKMFLLTKN